MPKPVYIVCAESVVEDKRTNLVTMVNVLERIAAEVAAEKPDGPRDLGEKLRFTAVAVWMREDGDEDVEYESRFVLHMPPDGEVQTTDTQHVRFSPTKHLNRLILRFEGVPFGGSGTLLVKNEIRRVDGDAGWIGQEFPIAISVTTPAAAHDPSDN